MEKLTAAIQARTDIQPDKLEYILSYFKKEQFREQHYLLAAGDTASSLYFIESGAVRVGIYTSNKDVTRHLACPGSFITSVDSFTNQTASAEFLQTTMRTTAFSISYADMKHLMEQLPEWERLVRLLIQEYFISCQQRINHLLTQSTESYYLHLLTYHPEILQSMPLYQLASYLGVEPQSLSRIRNNIVKK